MKPLRQIVNIQNLRKQRFIRDTVVLLLGATLMQLLGYSVVLDIAFVIIFLIVAIGSFTVTQYRKDNTAWFVSGTLKSFSWFMDQVASLFIASGITIWVVLTNLSIMGFYAFLSLLFVGLLMEGAISPVKADKEPNASGEISDQDLERMLLKSLKRSIEETIGVTRLPRDMIEGTAQVHLRDNPNFSPLVFSYVSLRSQERADRNNRFVAIALVIVTIALVIATTLGR